MESLAVFVSGTGSLLEAIIKDGLEIKFVLADRNCRGLEIARDAGIPTVLLVRSFGPDFDRMVYTLEVVRELHAHKTSFVAMAGFMTILDSLIFTSYRNRI